MDIERLNIIAEWLEAGAPHKDGVDGFDMLSFIEETPCGTTCCIGGAAIQFFGDSDTSFPDDHAQALLGLDSDVADMLFYGGMTWDGRGEAVPLEDITPAWAARCIRKLMETGEVDWVGTQAA